MTRRSPETVRFRDFFFAFAGDLTRRVSNTFLTRDSCLKKWNQGSRALRQRTACENTLCRLMQNRPPHGAKKSDTSLIPIVSKLVSDLVREAGLEPARPEWTLEPESSESANSTTRAYPKFFSHRRKRKVVRVMGLEPTRPVEHKHLKLACLPIPAHSQISLKSNACLL